MAIQEAFDDLFHVLYSLPQTVHTNKVGAIVFPFEYRSQLKKWASERAQYQEKPVKRSHLEEARNAWTVCSSKDDYSQLTQRNVRMLCSDGSMLRVAVFANYIQKNAEHLSPRTIRTLVPTMHNEWNVGSTTHDLIRAAALSWIQQYVGKDKTLLLWKSSSEKLLSPAGPTLIGKQVVEKLEDSRAVLERYRLKTGMSMFAVAANDAALAQLCNIVGTSQQPRHDMWQFLLERLLRDGLLSRTAKEKAVYHLIMTLRLKDESSWGQTKEDLKTFVLTSKEFGDPRLNPERWTKAPSEVVDTLIAWLSEEDIEFFFNLIITFDPHGRKKYWLQFVPHIKCSRVAVSATDETNHYLKLKEWRRKGRDFAKVSGEASAFILDFGSFVAVEFSKVNNACFIFDKQSFARAVGSLYSKSFDVGALKSPRYWHRQPHHTNWQSDLTSVLAGIGLRPVRKLR